MHTADGEVGRRQQRAGIRLLGGKLLVALLLLATPWLATALPRPDPVPGGVAVLTLPAVSMPPPRRASPASRC